MVTTTGAELISPHNAPLRNRYQGSLPILQRVPDLTPTLPREGNTYLHYLSDQEVRDPQRHVKEDGNEGHNPFQCCKLHMPPFHPGICTVQCLPLSHESLVRHILFHIIDDFKFRGAQSPEGLEVGMPEDSKHNPNHTRSDDDWCLDLIGYNASIGPLAI